MFSSWWPVEPTQPPAPDSAVLRRELLRARQEYESALLDGEIQLSRSLGTPISLVSLSSSEDGLLSTWMATLSGPDRIAEQLQAHLAQEPSSAVALAEVTRECVEDLKKAARVLRNMAALSLNPTEVTLYEGSSSLLNEVIECVYDLALFFSGTARTAGSAARQEEGRGMVGSSVVVDSGTYYVHFEIEDEGVAEDEGGVPEARRKGKGELTSEGPLPRANAALIGAYVAGLCLVAKSQLTTRVSEGFIRNRHLMGEGAAQKSPLELAANIRDRLVTLIEFTDSCRVCWEDYKSKENDQTSYRNSTCACNFHVCQDCASTLVTCPTCKAATAYVPM